MPDEIARDGLCRSATFELRATDDEAGDGFTIDGYATVFDSPTRIDSWEGVFDEEFAFGAFGRSIRARLPKMQFDHGMHPTIGSLPIGRWESVSEDNAGLHTVGRMHDNWLVEPVREAIREGSVDGMSIRFSVVREVWTDKDGKTVKPEDVLHLLYEPGERGPLKRVIREAKITEAGPVVWPAYQQTSVGVRSKVVTIDLGRLTDREQLKTLARAVFLADAANAAEPDGPQVTDESPDEHSTREVDPPVTDPAPDQHPSAEALRRRDRMRSRARSYASLTLALTDKD
jgi:HK97 family phage prohead protease